MRLDAQALERASREASLPVPIRFVASTGSTNTDLARDVRAHHGAALLADQQTEGRGRLGRSWVSAPGTSLHLSVLLRPALAPDRVPLIALAAAVATAEAAGPSFRIKWPNDILAPDGRKVGGILSEVEFAGNEVDRVIVGIGLNVHAAPDLPEATSLYAVDGRVRDRAELAARVVRCLLDASASLEEDPRLVLERWRARSATLGCTVEVGGVRGLAIDVDPDGALRLRTKDGEQRILAGDVELVGRCPPAAVHRGC